MFIELLGLVIFVMYFEFVDGVVVVMRYSVNSEEMVRLIVMMWKVWCFVRWWVCE